MYSGEDLELNGINEQIGEIFKAGIVSSIDPTTCTVRVTFPDRDDMVSADLPIIQRNCGETQDYSLPAVGDNVLCGFLGTGTEDGFVFGSFYNKKKTSQLNSENIRGLIFPDGTKITYDSKEKICNVEAAGKVQVSAKGEVNVSSEKNIYATSKKNIFAKADEAVTVEAAKTLEIKSAVKINLTAPSIALNAGSISFGTPDGEPCTGVCTGAFALKSEKNISLKAKRIDLG